jgi:hypothetical protein
MASTIARTGFGMQPADTRARRYDAPAARTTTRYDAPTTDRRSIHAPAARATAYRAPSDRIDTNYAAPGARLDRRA